MKHLLFFIFIFFLLFSCQKESNNPYKQTRELNNFLPLEFQTNTNKLLHLAKDSSIAQQLSEYYFALYNYKTKGFNTQIDSLESSVHNLTLSKNPKEKLQGQFLILFNYLENSNFDKANIYLDDILLNIDSCRANPEYKNFLEEYISILHFSLPIEIDGYHNLDQHLPEKPGSFTTFLNFAKAVSNKNKEQLKDLIENELQTKNYFNALLFSKKYLFELENNPNKLVCLQKLIQVADSTNNNSFLPFFNTALGEYFLENGEFNLAETHFRKNNYLGSSINKSNIALTRFYRDHNMSKVIPIMNEAINESTSLNDKIKILEQKRKTYEYIKDSENTLQIEDEIVLKKIKLSESNYSKSVFLEKILHLNERKRTLENLELSNNNISSQINQSDSTLNFLIIFLILTLFLIFFYRKKIVLFKEIEHKNTQIIAQKKSLEKVIYEIENSNKYLNSYNHIAAHDIRNPLITIFGYSDILYKKLKNKISEEERSSLKLINKESKNLSDFINQLLKLPTLGHTIKDKENVDLNQLLTNLKKYILDDSILKKGVINIDKNLGSVIANDFQIEELFFHTLKFLLLGENKSSHIIHIYKENKYLVFELKNAYLIDNYIDNLEYIFIKRIVEINKWNQIIENKNKIMFTLYSSLED